MREVRISAPEGEAAELVRALQRLGFDPRTVVQRQLVADGDRWEALVSVETSTPGAARLVEALREREYLDGSMHRVTVRELRAVVGPEPLAAITVPLEVPGIDVDQDLWQFSHVTYGHVGRVIVAACLLAYAMLRGNVLLLVAGLLFLPGLPHLLAIGRGACERDGSLALHGAKALLTTVMLVVVCGALVATATLGPLRFDDFLPPAVSAAVSVGIGIAGALASLDDVGKRELLGLATAAQVGVVPAWLGISLVRGFDVSPAPRLLAYLAGLAIIAITAALVYGAVRMRRRTTQPRRSSPSPLSTTDSQHVGRP